MACRYFDPVSNESLFPQIREVYDCLKGFPLSGGSEVSFVRPAMEGRTLTSPDLTPGGTQREPGEKQMVRVDLEVEVE